MDQLDKSDKDYAVVLSDDRKIVGIITQSAMSRGLAEYVWGEENE